MKLSILTEVVIIGLLPLAVTMVAAAQPASIPYHKEAYTLESGEYVGPTEPGAASFVAFTQVVCVSEAPWLQLHLALLQK